MLYRKKVQTVGLHRTVWALWLFEDPNYYLQVNYSREHVAWGCVASAIQPYPQSQNYLKCHSPVPVAADSLSDNSIAFCKEVLSEKTEISCSPPNPWAWSWPEPAELLDEDERHLCSLAGVLCCTKDKWIALMKSMSTSSSFSTGWLCLPRPGNEKSGPQ